MIHPRYITGTLVIGMLMMLIPTKGFAVENISSECTDAIYQSLAHEERMFRSVIFGQQKSEDLSIGSVRYDKEHATWIKKAEDEWQSLNENKDATTWSDSLMDDEADVPERRGIVEWRKTPTSDLIPSMLQSFRALQCRLQAVCMTSTASQGAKDEKTVKVQPDGCLEFEMDTMKACDVTNFGRVGAGTCDAVTEAILAREEKMLQLLVMYDAAYRTLLQFSGTFEGFMEDFRFPLLEPLWQMVRTMGALDNLPCFTAQCNE